MIEQDEDWKRFMATIEPNRHAEIEHMYLAFRARLIRELRVDGHTNQGVVSASLDVRRFFT